MNLKEVDINIEEWEMVEIPFYTEEELTYRLNNNLPLTKSEFEEQESKKMSTYKEIENLHINTGGKELTQEQIEEAKSFIDSQGFKDMIREAKESRQRVMESKITERTKMWLITPMWREEDEGWKRIKL